MIFIVYSELILRNIGVFTTNEVTSGDKGKDVCALKMREKGREKDKIKW